MKVLIVVDMQNDFINGALGTPEAQAIVPNVCQEIVHRADPNTVILFTKDTHESNYMKTLEGKNLPVPHCIKDTDGWLIHAPVWNTFRNLDTGYADVRANYGLMPLNPGVIEKPTFGSIDLQNILYCIDDECEGGVEEITLMGLCTGICVMSNAILAKATLPEVPVNVVANCCACVTPESHKTALEAMKLCQINII